MDDIALIISELVKENSDILNYNGVFTESEIRMLHRRGETVFSHKLFYNHFFFIIKHWSLILLATC
jgi:hypothetical protein